MVVISSSSLVEILRQVRLLDSDQLQELVALQARVPDPKALAGELIRRGWLSPYQANRLLQGKGHELLLGSYVLLEKLGEGGMGAVFKAKNWKLGRIVAIKLIRKERLENPDAIRRFEREVRSAAALSHPNIVHAFDADQIGGTHLLVMEYVEGATDLARLVKQNGPLPVSQACEHVRQAALGLQHAFERGMVHRDIKPANLLLTADGRTVKVLDMGLARLDRAGAEDGQSSIMTQEGAIMGTPDYIAPEQAVESHTVDIRADLYSLGCTFYFLLTGQAPFPTGTLIQKINKHQFEKPQPVEQLRPGLPPAVAAMVHRLMAKRPEDRFQTPAEVSAALARVSGTGSADERTVAEAGRVVHAAGAPEDTFTSPFAHLTTDEAEGMESPHRSSESGRRRRRLVRAAGVSLALVVGIAVLLFLFGKRPAREETSPREPAPVTAGPKATAKAADPDRAAAEYVLSLGGTLHVNGQEHKLGIKQAIKDAGHLPREPFQLTAVNFDGIKQVDDSTLARLKECSHLNGLGLSGTQVGDAGLIHLKDYKALEIQ